jgi:uncharacterized protein
VSDKIFISADELLLDSYRLARKIYDDGYRPDHIVALWRGGTPIGSAVQEAFKVYGHDCNHLAVKARSYHHNETKGEVDVPYIGTFLARLKEHDKVLVIDDVFDTGNTIKKVWTILHEHKSDIRVATVYFKPTKNQTQLKPDYYLHETDRWIVFPHELECLTPEELHLKNPKLADILGPHFVEKLGK